MFHPALRSNSKKPGPGLHHCWARTVVNAVICLDFGDDKGRRGEQNTCCNTLKAYPVITEPTGFGATSRGRYMLNEFKDFIAKGNVMDMAVGIIIGAAFTAIVKSMVGDLLLSLIHI